MSSLRVVVFDTVDVVLNVHGERHSVQTFFTHHAAETAGMVGLAERLEDLDAHTNKHTHTHRQDNSKSLERGHRVHELLY